MNTKTKRETDHYWTSLGGSASQMSRLASICVKALASYPFIRNLFASAELWELRRLRGRWLRTFSLKKTNFLIGAFQEIILQVVSSDPASLIPFLSACPPGHLGRKARNSAIEALYAQKNLEQSLEWLSRMAVESESFGPLVCISVTQKDNGRLNQKRHRMQMCLWNLQKSQGSRLKGVRLL